jgi:signal peptidase I
VVIFESPEYLSIGPLKDILQRVVYMITLSIVDIDKDENGQPKHHFLIKRAIGMPGDRIRMKDGNVEILTPGESVWVSEPTLKEDLGLHSPVVRLFKPEEYPLFTKAGIGLALEDSGLSSTDEQKSAINQYFRMSRDDKGSLSVQIHSLVDEKQVERWSYATKWAMEPYNAAARENWRALEEGYYVPEGKIFPMGDNRDNSRDARYFGPVRLEKVLGKGLLRYWPLGRFGAVR